MANPYELLGIELDATDADIERAFRQKVKTAHPDAGGTADAYDQLVKARDVLLDPELRGIFDETGEMDKVVDLKSIALNRLMEIVNKELDRCSMPANSFQPPKDPETIDWVKVIHAACTEDMMQVDRELENFEKQIKVSENVAKRWIRKTGDGENMLANMLRNRAKMARVARSRVRLRAKMISTVTAILGDYDFNVLVPEKLTGPRPPDAFGSKLFEAPYMGYHGGTDFNPFGT